MGIAYWPCHDPRRGDLLSYALFDAMGERSWEAGDPAQHLDEKEWRQKIENELTIEIDDEPPADLEMRFVDDL
jgi:hypothetical protein